MQSQSIKTCLRCDKHVETRKDIASCVNVPAIFLSLVSMLSGIPQLLLLSSLMALPTPAARPWCLWFSLVGVQVWLTRPSRAPASYSVFKPTGCFLGYSVNPFLLGASGSQWRLKQMCIILNFAMATHFLKIYVFYIYEYFACTSEDSIRQLWAAVHIGDGNWTQDLRKSGKCS